MSPFRDIATPFELCAPASVEAPVLFNSAHSGRLYPRDFLTQSRLSRDELRRSEDAHVDDLFSLAPAMGMVLMKAHFPRSFLDLNREAYELDPRMFDGDLPPAANTRSQRVVGGLGSIPRIVGDHAEIYAKRLPVAEMHARIEGLYKPYHQLLDQALVALRRKFGLSILVDCHSMPSYAQARSDGQKADIILGDRFGTSAEGALVDHIETVLTDMGYRIRRNQPYAGGYITEYYGRPRDGRHAVQVEINRALYMNERSYEPLASYASVKADMTRLMAAIKDWPDAGRGSIPFAAE